MWDGVWERVTGDPSKVLRRNYGPVSVSHYLYCKFTYLTVFTILSFHYVHCGNLKIGVTIERIETKDGLYTVTTKGNNRREKDFRRVIKWEYLGIEVTG